MISRKPTAERLREVLDYNAETGVFMWRQVRKFSNKKVGQIAGGVNKSTGYIYIMVDGHNDAAHRWAWLYVHDSWPSDMIDHVDGDRTNNRIANLREATKTLNGQNQKRAQRGNRTTGLLGVSKYKNRKTNPYTAMIRVAGKPKYLGVFPTPELAHEAYLTAKRALHEGCTI